jgi:redox-sensitive bicupin YhaK (pirin superfamily)
VTSRELGIYAGGGTLHLKAGLSGAEFLVLSGQPISEPIAQYGPFVMNTREEIESALRDFQNPQFLSGLASNRMAG